MERRTLPVPFVPLPPRSCIGPKGPTQIPGLRTEPARDGDLSAPSDGIVKRRIEPRTSAIVSVMKRVSVEGVEGLHTRFPTVDPTEEVGLVQ